MTHKQTGRKMDALSVRYFKPFSLSSSLCFTLFIINTSIQNKHFQLVTSQEKISIVRKHLIHSKLSFTFLLSHLESYYWCIKHFSHMNTKKKLQVLFFVNHLLTFQARKHLVFISFELQNLFSETSHKPIKNIFILLFVAFQIFFGYWNHDERFSVL